MRENTQTERAIVSAMAQTRRRRQDEDVVSRLADAGEDVFRRLVALPRRMVVGVMNGVGERLHDVATKLGGPDPLAHRVATIEKRLDSLEMRKKTTARRASTGAKRPATRRASTPAPPAEAQQQGGARAEGEGEHAR
jgi:hypothetical protein